jgi:hypothetical protein
MGIIVRHSCNDESNPPLDGHRRRVELLGGLNNLRWRRTLLKMLSFCVYVGAMYVSNGGY